MGCDIHLHIEVKINGQWEHYAHPLIDRNYRLFALMAGVRNRDDITPVSLPKGLPDDITPLTRYDAEDYWGRDGHSHSYFTKEEIAELEDRIVAEGLLKDQWRLEMDIWHCYFLGSSFGSIVKYPEDWRRPNRRAITDVRFVFWFDN